MPNSKRWEPFIDNKRACKECKIIKDRSEYYYNISNGGTSSVCRECTRVKKRKAYITTSLGYKKEDGTFIDQKKCIICEQVKDLTTTNFNYRNQNTKNFYNVCIECIDKRTSDRRGERRVKGNREDNELKFCNICKQTKTIKEFSYNRNKGKGFYSYCCRECDRNRKTTDNTKKRKVDKFKMLITNYSLIDFRKNQICDLTYEFVKEKLSKPCFYCDYPSDGLDRIDNSKGHIMNNCIPACKECNIARMDSFTCDEMVIIGAAIKEVKDARKITP